MGIFTRTITNILNGISQQPAILRDDSQCEDMLNMVPKLSEGLSRRPSLEHILTLASGAGTNFVKKTAIISLADSDRWFVVITTDEVKIWKLDTFEAATVSYAGLPGGVMHAYLKPPASVNLEILTVADVTFILNTSAVIGTVSNGTAWGSEVDVQTFSDLPATGAANTRYKIIGAGTSQDEYYYVEWDATTSTYVETGNRPYTQPDPATMPVALVRTGPLSFALQTISWDRVNVGDASIVPNPSFVGKSIKDIFFHRNRLGFVTNSGVVLSRAGDYYNFYPKTATAVLDDDPIDVSVAHTKATDLAYAVPFNKSVLLFGSEAQFQLSAQDVLSPRTVRVDPVTEYPCNTKVRPVSIGANVYFIENRGVHSLLREYYVRDDAVTNEAFNVSAHAPRLIPAAVKDMQALTRERMLVILADNSVEPLTMYAYRMEFDEAGRRLQSAWYRWESPNFAWDNDPPVFKSLAVDGSDLYVSADTSLTRYAFRMRFDKSEASGWLTDVNGKKVHLHLDGSALVTAGTYDAVNDVTPLPHTVSTINVGAVAVDRLTGVVYDVINTAAGVFNIAGNHQGRAFAVGVPFLSKWVPSEVLMRDRNGQPISHGRLQLRRLGIRIHETGNVDVVITRPDRSPVIRTFWSPSLTDPLVEYAQMESRTFGVSVMGDAKNTRVTLQTSSPFPMTIHDVHWTGSYYSRLG